MNNLDQMKLIKLCVKDLDEAVCAYEGARKKNPNTVDYLWGCRSIIRASRFTAESYSCVMIYCGLERSLNMDVNELKPCPFCGGKP